MDRVPLEMVIRHASRSIGDYFSNQVEEKRRNGKVAVLVEDYTNSLYFMECDKYGYPNVHMFKYVSFNSLDIGVITSEQMLSTPVSMSVDEVSIMIEKPMLTQRFDYMDKPYVFMWYGRKIGSKKIPIEQLNVSELMRLAQQAIINREGLVIDEALKNKIYK